MSPSSAAQQGPRSSVRALALTHGGMSPHWLTVHTVGFRDPESVILYAPPPDCMDSGSGHAVGFQDPGSRILYAPQTAWIQAQQYLGGRGHAGLRGQQGG